MTMVGPGDPVAAALRGELAALRSRTAARGGKPAEVGTPRAATTLAQRIACIPGDDPQRQRKAVRLFLEARIARELGTRLLNDPAFALMLDAIDRELRQDADTAVAVDALGAWLCRPRG